MLENARRQTIFVIIVALLAGIFLFQPYNRGLDLKGGTQLFLEVDKAKAQATGMVERSTNWDVVMQDTIRIIHDRIDPSGIKEAVVTRRGETGILVEIPAAQDKAETDAIVQRILTLGKLEERVVARDDFFSEKVKFELTKEKGKLTAWLDKGNNRDVLLKDPQKIALFHNLKAEDGGRLTQPVDGLRWVPHKIKAKKAKSGLLEWDRAYSEWLEPATVLASKPEARSTPPKLATDYLLEYIAINWVEEKFEGSQMDPTQVGVTMDSESGGNAVAYAMKSMFTSDYAEWSRRYIGKHAAIILNGYVESAPVFQSAITGGHGIIRGSFTQLEAQGLANVLKTGSLQVLPELQQEYTLGASLGQQALNKGLLSILVGGLLVVVFMFWYYGLSGFVANIALALNLLLIIGIMQFIRATYTLPGLAGIVLTLGMAVDANILIYERIREELARGKAVVQAVRAGFDRALVTIIDANLTTFIAGLVLYQVGIGPIRGFAVTLCVGIVTTIFTAFFVTRLLFHFLLVKQKLKEVKMRAMFTHVNVDWLRASRPACVVSVTLIVLGLIGFTLIPKDISMGIDFRGGASLTVAVEQPMRVNDMVAKLRADKTFGSEFHNPIVTTVGATEANGAAKSFSIKVKLTEAQARKTDQEIADGVKEGKKVEPFYVRDLKAALAGLLVQDAAANPKIVQNPRDKAWAYASIDLRFETAVKIVDLQKLLREGDEKLPGAEVSSIPENQDSAKTVKVQFDVESSTKPEQLLGIVRKAVTAQAKDEAGNPAGQLLKDVDGKAARLSDPIPNSDRIGGRMVAELRNAAIGSILLSLFLMAMYIRVRFHEYKYGIAAAVAIIHDLLVSFGVVVFANYMGWVSVELDLGMIAAFLTVVGYSINDTIVVFDRFRENLSDQKRLGDSTESFRDILNRSINQTMSRTVWTTATVVFVVFAQFVVNYGAGSSLEGFSFCLLIGVLSGVYSTIYVATPILVLLHNREERKKPLGGAATPAELAPAKA